MNDEEIKAIRSIEKLIKWLEKWNDKYEIVPEDKKYFEIILNLIEKQKAEISNLKWKNEIYVKSIKSHDRYEIELNDEIIEKNNKIFDLEAEIEKKDKIIEEMAIYLADIDFDECCAEIPEPCLSCSWEDYEPHTNCIKEYFENKVKESK